MYILPYYIVKSSATEFKAQTAWIFLECGKKLWETENKKLTNKQVINEYLIPNGFVGRCVCVKENVMYFEVDPSKMKMSEFYTWTDFLSEEKPIPQNLDIWRPFLLLGEPADDYFWKSEAEYFPFLNSFWSLAV